MKVELRNLNNYSVIVTLCILGLSGLLSYDTSGSVYFQINFLPATSILELLVLTIWLSNLNLARSLLNRKVTLFLIVYIFLCCCLFFIKGKYSVLDFLLIYKFVIYLTMLSFILKKQFKIDDLYRILIFLTVMFFLKYTIAKFIFGIPRPGLYTENNFELMTLLMFYGYFLSSNLKINKILTIAIIVVIMISGSRSAQLCFLFCYFINYKFTSISDIFFKSISAVLILFVFIFIFISRLGEGSLESIDRFFFMTLFIQELSLASIFELMFGHPIITPLSAYTCSSLSFYQSLFSFTNENICFSVILHSFILRTLFDFGFLGSLILFSILIKLMISQNIPIKVIICLAGVALINGLSVSSFNSVYFMFPILMIFMTDRENISAHTYKL